MQIKTVFFCWVGQTLFLCLSCFRVSLCVSLPGRSPGPYIPVSPSSSLSFLLSFVGQALFLCLSCFPALPLCFPARPIAPAIHPCLCFFFSFFLPYFLSSARHHSSASPDFVLSLCVSLPCRSPGPYIPVSASSSLSFLPSFALRPTSRLWLVHLTGYSRQGNPPIRVDSLGPPIGLLAPSRPQP